MAEASEVLPGKVASSLTEQLKEFAGSWAKYSALVSVALYVAGYLALRFHVTALGVGTDLAVLDERYVFTGARFLIYTGSALPIIVFVLLVCCALFVGANWLCRQARRGKSWLMKRTRVAAWWTRWDKPWLARRERFATWWAQVCLRWRHPTRLAVLGVTLSVALIQFVMRQCFQLSNLLVAECLPSYWPYLLLHNPTNAGHFFTALVAGVIVTAALWYAAHRAAEQTAWSRGWMALLAVLVAIQFLLLPVNYGALIVDKTLPQVADLGGIEQLQSGTEPLPGGRTFCDGAEATNPVTAGQEAWLVWEGKEGATWLVRTGDSRKLVTLPQKEVKKTQIIRYDPLANVLTTRMCGDP